MKKGDIINIFENPITRERLEGKVRLIRHLKTDGDLEYWRVHFLNDYRGSNWDRWIRKEEESE